MALKIVGFILFRKCKSSGDEANENNGSERNFDHQQAPESRSGIVERIGKTHQQHEDAGRMEQDNHERRESSWGVIGAICLCFQRCRLC